MTARPSRLYWLALLVAVAGLNLGLTFHNLWPTPWVTTRHELSLELAVLLLAMALYARWRPALSGRAVNVLAALFTIACIARYAQVTADALYGRPVDLYWDARHLPRVAAMLAEASSGWVVLAASLALVALLAAIYLALRWMLACVAQAVTHLTSRHMLAGLGGAMLGLFVLGHLHPGSGIAGWFSLPVSMTYGQQLARLRQSLAGDPPELDAPALPASTLRRVAGADVIVVFLESYGATTFDRPDFARALSARRAALAEALQRTGRKAVSAFVTSPTYGGASWLAHASFLSGVEVRENRAYQHLLGGRRETLVHRFADHGYRTLGLMPGLRQPWPEGAFYGYQRVYDAHGLDYRGPAFGWWRIPDQYALARVDERELDRRPRAPILLVFTSISTHVPFRPLPPYQPDWRVVLGETPFPPAQLRASLGRTPSWSELGTTYRESVDYALTWLAGYLHERAGDDLVLILLGDHQPLAGVSGPDQPWDVPIHVIADRPALIQALLAEGFTPGMIPRRPVLGPMHELTLRILRAFGG